MTKQDVYLITWEDSSMGSTGWKNLAKPDFNTGTMLIDSIGVLYYEDKKKIVLVPHIAHQMNQMKEHQMCGYMEIPKSAIRGKKKIHTIIHK